MKEKELHLIKRVSKELGLTYRELGEKIGYSESNLRRSVSTNQLSTQLKKALELYLEIVKLKKKEDLNERIKDSIETYLMNILNKLRT